jgi:hypothetical protein
MEPGTPSRSSAAGPKPWPHKFAGRVVMVARGPQAHPDTAEPLAPAKTYRTDRLKGGGFGASVEY